MSTILPVGGLTPVGAEGVGSWVVGWRNPLTEGGRERDNEKMFFLNKLLLSPSTLTNPEIMMSKLLRPLLSFLLLVPVFLPAQEAPEAPETLVEAEQPLVAVFVANRAKGRRGLDEEVDAIRDVITAELAGEVRVMDPQDVTDAFRKWKISTTEERNRLVEGVFTGGSVVRIAEMVGADAVMTVAVTSADVMDFASHRNARLTLAVKVLDAKDAGALDGFVITRQLPIRGVEVDSEALFRILYRDAAREAAERVVKGVDKWKLVPRDAQEAVMLTVSTPIDQLTNGLSQGIRAPNDLLDEVRRVVGGVTVWIDGAVVGSTPGTYRISPGFHTVRVTREWMKPWEGVVNVKEDMNLNVALELSPQGLQQWKTIERLKAEVALDYARALSIRGIKLNLTTENWRDVGQTLGTSVEVLLQETLEASP